LRSREERLSPILWIGYVKSIIAEVSLIKCHADGLMQSSREQPGFYYSCPNAEMTALCFENAMSFNKSTASAKYWSLESGVLSP
jgi:hypothetical protein